MTLMEFTVDGMMYDFYVLFIPA